jgi:hypothetical protein
MTELYRGLIEILVMRFIEQVETLRMHIRANNSGRVENFEIDIGVSGFWNLMLEITFTIFSIIFLLSGVCLAATLAIVSYPFAAFINYGSWLLINTKNPQKPIDEQPKIIKTDRENNGL